jgi:hypothetical protein
VERWKTIVRDEADVSHTELTDESLTNIKGCLSAATVHLDSAMRLLEYRTDLTVLKDTVATYRSALDELVRSLGRRF